MSDEVHIPADQIVRAMQADHWPPRCTTKAQYEYWAGPKGPHQGRPRNFCEDCLESWADIKEAAGRCDYRATKRRLIKAEEERREKIREIIESARD